MFQRFREGISDYRSSLTRDRARYRRLRYPHTPHIELRLLPFVFLLYISNYLDRTSVAYTAISMARHLGFDDRVFGLGTGIFFLSYVALQIPGAILAQRWERARHDLRKHDRVGITDRAHRGRATPAQLYVARFLLGAAEAGLFRGVIVYLSHWFIQEDWAKATSNFMAAIPVSLIIGSPVAGWNLSHNWFAIEGWRWLFFRDGDFRTIHASGPSAPF